MNIVIIIWEMNSLIYLEWLDRQPQGPLVFMSPVLRLQWPTSRCWGSKLMSFACTPNTSLSELSPQPWVRSLPTDWSPASLTSFPVTTNSVTQTWTLYSIAHDSFTTPSSGRMVSVGHSRWWEGSLSVPYPLSVTPAHMWWLSPWYMGSVRFWIFKLYFSLNSVVTYNLWLPYQKAQV